MSKYKLEFNDIVCIVSVLNNVLKINGLKTIVILSILITIGKVCRDFYNHKKYNKKIKHIVALITYIILLFN